MSELIRVVIEVAPEGGVRVELEAPNALTIIQTLKALPEIADRLSFALLRVSKPKEVP